MIIYFIFINRECRRMFCVIVLDILIKIWYIVYIILIVCICKILIKEVVIFG